MAATVIDPLVAGVPAPSSDRQLLTDVFGAALADVGVAPRLGAQLALDRLRAAADGLRPAARIFPEAARLFATAELDGEDPEAYVDRVVRSSGLPARTVRLAVTDIVAEIEALDRTVAAELPPPLPSATHRVEWVPGGRVFAAVMAGNHPLPHVSWVHALFVGYSVLVRPGSRDPFTPRRLVAALLAAGLPPHKLAHLPCDHRAAAFLLDSADRGIVFGGDQAVASWRDARHVATRGPGRSRALLDTAPTPELLDHLATAVGYDGGTRCTNLSAVLTTAPVARVADELAARLARLPVLPATDPEATLLVVGRERAEALRRHVATLADGLTDHSTPHYDGDFVVDLGDGSFLLRPLVLSADRADHPAVGAELGFPFVVVAPWSADRDAGALGPALVLNLLTDDDALVARAVQDPRIRKVTVGTALPWDLVPGLPHDGSLTQFLLEPKGVVVPGAVVPGADGG
ncbi:aldehyde dehydrogenase family protein [Kitasatospora sp. NPDC089509]|uniref:aldehyde dehydrogenase family protein n=1 Tax=Kitasatospora sp. NPDC089509 TaxID=3364079 RepID=UPI0038172956